MTINYIYEGYTKLCSSVTRLFSGTGWLIGERMTLSTVGISHVAECLITGVTLGFTSISLALRLLFELQLMGAGHM